MARINLEEFRQHESDGLITGRKHPVLDLIIWNYTSRCQFTRTWDDITTQARGLITDIEGNIVAKPFRKFWNLSEILGQGGQIPAEDFVVTEKFDGSLGVSYRDADGRYSLATRGSFVSDQARKGTAMLREQYAGAQVALNDYPDMTFLFEIIYPENRIVVDYSGKEQLVLIAAISTNSGHEWYYEQLRGFAEMAEIPVVTKYDGITDFEKIESRPNSEGYVVHFPSSGQRFKVKFDEYVRLHKLITGVNKKTIWELLMNNHPVTELLDRVPDEFYKWVGDTINELRMQYAAIELSAQNQFEELTPYYGNRKEFAIRATKMTYRSILFNMLDKKAYDQVIWKMIRPVAEQPFKEDIDG